MSRNAPSPVPLQSPAAEASSVSGLRGMLPLAGGAMSANARAGSGFGLLVGLDLLQPERVLVRLLLHGQYEQDHGDR